MAQLPRYQITVLAASGSAPSLAANVVLDEFWLLGADSLYHKFSVNSDGMLQDSEQTSTSPSTAQSPGTVAANMLPVTGASVALYREGATINGNQSGTSPFAITVRDKGACAGGDTVFLGTVSGTTYSVDSTAATTVTISGFAGTLNVTNGTRIVPSNTQPTLYSDDQGGATKTNPLTTNAQGLAFCYVAQGHYDVLVSGGGSTTNLYESTQVGSPSY